MENLFGDVEELKPISGNVIDYLNDKKTSKIPFKKTHSNLKEIEARIKEKFTMDDFKMVTDYKISEWKDNPKMKKYIRPVTLYGTKFNQYLVEANESLNETKKVDKFENKRNQMQSDNEMLQYLKT